MQCDIGQDPVQVRKNKIILFGIFALTRLVYLLSQSRAWIGQGWEYEELANNFLKTGRYVYFYSWNPTRELPTAIEPPGLAFILVFIKKYFYNHTFLILASLHFGIALISFWLFLQICDSFLSSKATQLAGILYILDINLWSPLRWVNETLYSVFFITLMLYTTLNLIKKPSIRSGIALGISFGAALWFRSSFELYFLFFIGWLLYIRYREGQNRMSFAVIVSVVISCAAVISPWTLRNYQTFKTFILVQNTMGLNLWQGWNPTSVGALYQMDGTPMIMEPWLISKLQACASEPQINDTLKEAAFGYAGENPARWIKQRLLGFLFFWHEQTFWAPHSPFRTKQAFILGVANLFLLLFLLLSVPNAWRAGGTLRIILMLMAMQSAIYTLIHADIGNRYRIQIDPLILIVIASYFSTFLPNQELKAAVARQ